MKYIILILVIFYEINALDSFNISFEQVRVKQLAKNNSECYIHIEVNGNKEWEENKEKLNTIIDKKNKCREIVIYKYIKNVDILSQNNIGTIIQKHNNVNVKTITIIKNSNIRSSSLNFNSNSKLNIGNFIETSPFETTYLNNIEMRSNILIENSNIGSDLFNDNDMINYMTEGSIPSI